jgi:diguanylate cyclase (GGDEF)-like protein
VPVALLVGILVASVVINVALIVLVARADEFALRGPRFLRPVIDLLRSDQAAADEFPPRRRALYVADQQPRPALTAPPLVRMSPGAGRSGAGVTAPLTETLPPDLAEFLSRPAEIAMPAEAPGRAAGNGEGLALLARWPRPGNGGGFERDTLTGVEGPASWGRILEIENARLLRYRRPVTIVMADVEGLQRLADRMGDEPVRRLLPVIADALVREARSSDWVARIGDGRFAALLPETDEIQAINYVERVRTACEPWLASAAVQLRLAIGWSSPTASSDLEFAIRRAEERMNADRRAPGRGATPARAVPAAFVTLASRVGGAADRGTLEASAAPPAVEAEVGTAAEPAAAEPSAAEPSPQPEAAGSGRSRSRRKRGAGPREA